MPPPESAATAGSPVHFTTAAYGSPQRAFQRYCELTADLCDVTMLGDVADFQVATTTWHLAGALLIENRTSALKYDRTSLHVGRGIDHFQVALYISGGAEFVQAEQVLHQRAGDVSIIDMAQPNQTRERPGKDGAATVLTCMLPRVLVSPVASGVIPLPPISVFGHDTAFGRLLGDFLLGLRRCSCDLTYGQSQASVQALVQLVLGGSGHSASVSAPTHRSKQALHGEVKRFIEKNLGSDSLGVESLCRRFAISRASLYRLFGSTSPASYIQQRRLQRAFAMLISPAFQSWRILDVALECQFAGDAAFIRAFRREFGLTPGDARELSASTISDAPLPRAHARDHPWPDAEAVNWVRQLTSAMPQPALLP
jgi:AraC-like DNA-binding protein